MNYVQNLNVGVRNTLVSVLVKRGKSEDQAEALADQHLEAAVEHVNGYVSSYTPANKMVEERLKHDVSLPMREAFASLKAWVLDNIS